jgi:16S rRNA (guanine527-N7)-methyltransferase
MSLLSKWKDEGTLEKGAYETLQRFLDLLIHWNSKINLTGLGSREAIEEILIEESVLAIRAFPMTGKRVLDFGSGAGIPGLIWAIVDPSLQLTSLEIRSKKVSFQKEVVRTLGLSMEVMQGRFPFAVRGRKFDIITTRAVAFDPGLVKSGLALLEPSGSLLRFASSSSQDNGWRVKPISDRSSLHIYP